jgi:hypothetical protein
MDQQLGVDQSGMPGYVLAQPARERRAPSRLVGVSIFAAAIAVAGGAVFVSVSSAGSWFPRRWDARVEPIAAEVARLRGLTFEHPVMIQYLAPKEFEKQLGDDGQMTADDRAELKREEAVLRAVGLVGGKVDLGSAVNTSEKSSTLAYYDPASQEIFVRGTTLDAEHRVTLAHELTHVLQDQHFDLQKLQKRATDSKTGDASALKALIEGDAVRIQQDYLEHLSKADQKEYDRENASEGERVGKETASVPEIVQLLSSAPYEFGPSTIRVLLEAGGNSAVDAALTGPTPSSSIFVAPGDLAPPIAVDEPLLPSGAVAQGSAEAFGPSETYLTLSVRLEPARALEAADLVSGGRAVTFRTAGTTCYRVAMSPTAARHRPALLRAVRDWARGRSKTTVDAVGDLVGFTACDPGPSAPVPSAARMHNAVQLLAIRTSITVEIAKGGVAGDVARCMARVFIETPGAAKLVLAIGNGAPTADQNAALQRIVLSSVQMCRADPDAGLS